MSRPTARVLALLDMLQSGGTRTVTELAERLGVDERTVRRYVAHLIELDVPVESIRGRYGGYRLAPGHRMPPLMLTDDEALATVLGLVAGQQGGLSAQFPTASDSALAKIRRVLPRALSRRLEALQKTTTFTSQVVNSNVSPEGRVLLTLAEAARDHHSVTITYIDRHGRSSERTLQPYGLVVHSGRWYVASRDSISQEIRTFRLDRISNPRALLGSFTVPAGFNSAEHVLSALASSPWTHEVSLKVEGTVEQIRRWLPAEIATIEQLETPPAGTWFRVQLRAESLDWLPNILASLDCPFIIERPSELHALVDALAQRLARYAAAGTSVRSTVDEKLAGPTS